MCQIIHFVRSGKSCLSFFSLSRSLTILIFYLCVSFVYSTPITNINAVYRDGQVFVTWDNVLADYFYLYKSSTPVIRGNQLSSAQNLGKVIFTSSQNVRTMTQLRIDSASPPLSSNKGLFAATSTANGQFFYTVTTMSGGIEDTTIVAGSNSLTSPVSETVNPPKPVWQENRTVGNHIIEVYVWFGTKITSSIYPAMTSAGSYPFNFGIIKNGVQSPHPVTVYMRPSSVHFLDAVGIGYPNEWILSIDDFVPNAPSYRSWYYGYHEDYDIYSTQNPIPTSGTLYNYTAAMAAHTIEWALGNRPLDSTRVYMLGYSLGATGVLFNSIMIPSKIAAIFVRAPLINPSAGGNHQQWGTYETNLPTNENMSRNQRLNANYLLSFRKLNSLPVILTACGKLDVNVGWAEKIPFYDSMNVLNHGGVHFWEMSDHSTVGYAWNPNFPNFFTYCTRYRTNLSYPAFSNCSVNDNPGNGNPFDGDSVGQINAYLDWNDDIVDTTYNWEITLKTKTIVNIYDTLYAPDSCTADVTLRRLQQFNPASGSTIQWSNIKNNVTVHEGSFIYTGGLITIPYVKIYSTESRLKVIEIPIGVKNINGVIPEKFALYQNYPNPFNPTTRIKYDIPKQYYVKLMIYDVLGREIAVLVNEQHKPGSYKVEWNASKYSSGVYFYKLITGDYAETKKMMLLK